jgi:cytochrome c
MQIQTQNCRKQALFTGVSRAGYLSLGFAVFALIIMLFQSPSSQVFARQADNEQSNAKRGQDVFAKRCSGCHSLDNDKEGPRLRGIYGKKAATLSTTFKYSEALKNSNVTWDAPSLDQWMAEPEKIVPNSDMFFRVPRANERADVVAYLKSLADQ